MGLRIKRSPQEFLKEVYIQQGSNEYYTSFDTYKAALAQAQAAGKTAYAEQITNAWQAWSQQFVATHPVFGDDLKSGTRQINAQFVMNQLETLFAKNQVPAGEQTDLTRGLVEDYQTYRAALIQADLAGKTAYKKQIKDAWLSYLDQTKTSDPRLATLINGVLARLPDPHYDPTTGAV